MNTGPSCGIRCTLLALALAGGLWVDLAGCSDDKADKQPADKQAAVVATLTAMQGSVDHRAARTLIWKPAAEQMPLHHRDALKTGKGATSRVTFKTGAALEIEELSLVVIEAQAEAPASPGPGQGAPARAPAPRVARLEQGTVRGVAHPGAPPVQVLTPDGKTTEIRARGDEPVPFRIRARKGGTLEVAVLKGTAEVSSGESRVVLKPRQVVDVSSGQVAKPVELLPYPELEAPPVDGKVVAGAEMALRWKAVQGAAMYRVQISHEVSFGDRLHDTTVVGPIFKLPAPKSKRTYVWRVASVDDAGRESELGFARRFHVDTAAKPDLPGQLLSPTDNAGIQYVRTPRPVTFSWKGTAPEYTVVVARHPSLTKLVVARRRTTQRAIKLSDLGRGVYYWGVFAGKGKERKPLFDKPHTLTIARRHPPYVRVPKSIDWK